MSTLSKKIMRLFEIDETFLSRQNLCESFKFDDFTHAGSLKGTDVVISSDPSFSESVTRSF